MNDEKRNPVRLCIFCTWLEMGYEEDWSEVTPGAGLEVVCYGRSRDVDPHDDEDPSGWRLDEPDFNTDSYRRHILRARKCTHFEVVGGEDGSVARFLRGEEPLDEQSESSS